MPLGAKNISTSKRRASGEPQAVSKRLHLDARSESESDEPASGLKNAGSSTVERAPRRRVSLNNVAADEYENVAPGLSEDEEMSYYSDDSAALEDKLDVTDVVGNVVGSRKWQETVKQVVRCVVSLKFMSVRPFDTEDAYVSDATGFVVDAERGIIMTNRHVVGPGPFSGYAVFDNHEECPVQPVYRDPVHDFGFLKFDPKAIKHMEVQDLALRPDLARVGCEIRVVGNDNGEKLSILAGFISRLDRNAPDYYGDIAYNDFNTEYIQAAASSSGGSSGSPVVTVDGDVVALQAGGSTHAATNYFLPLSRGKRALECIQRGEPVTRGTIQAQWLLKPFEECSRLGLTQEAENAAREKFPDAIGMLVASTVLPEGPSDGHVKEGDCLISINGEPVVHFARVDEILDSSVGSEIEVTVQRSGRYVTNKIAVGDLHAITPDRYVEVSGTIVHNLSYQIARSYSLPVKGLYIANVSSTFGGARGDHGYLLDEVDDKPTPDLDTFIQVMKEIPDGKRVTFRYRHVADMHTTLYHTVFVDRHWTRKMVLAVRNDETGLWDFFPQGEPLPPVSPERQSARFKDFRFEGKDFSHLNRSFVEVMVSTPSRYEGIDPNSMSEYGLVIDAEKGYVLVSRVTVPHDMCDIHIVIAQSIIVPGRIVFLHPYQNYAVVAYDPALVDAPITSAELSDMPIQQGDSLLFVGHTQTRRVVATRTNVTDISSAVVPYSQEVSPRYRATNIESISLDTQLAVDCSSGVLINDSGVVCALWMSYLGDTTSRGKERHYRVATQAVAHRKVIEQLRRGEKPNPRFMDIEVHGIQIVDARLRGVGESWITRVQEDSSTLEMYSVLRVSHGLSPLLQEGDILLEVNGRVVITKRDLDLPDDCAEAEVKIVRNRKEMTLKVPTVGASDFRTDRVVYWCGLSVHRPHHAVRQQIKNLPSEVYIVQCAKGSPGDQYGVSSTFFITDVDEKPTPTLEEFWNVISQIPDNTYVKLRVVTFDNLPCALSIKTNYHYFPTAQRVRDPETGDWSVIGSTNSTIYDGVD